MEVFCKQLFSHLTVRKYEENVFPIFNNYIFLQNLTQRELLTCGNQSQRTSQEVFIEKNKMFLLHLVAYPTAFSEENIIPTFRNHYCGSYFFTQSVCLAYKEHSNNNKPTGPYKAVRLLCANYSLPEGRGKYGKEEVASICVRYLSKQ